MVSLLELCLAHVVHISAVHGDTNYYNAFIGAFFEREAKALPHSLIKKKVPSF
jgi:hypothetical protein